MNSIPKCPIEIPMPKVNQPQNVSKIKRVYEDDNWVIDVMDGDIRISYFENYHFVDDIKISEETFKGGVVSE